MVNLVSTLYNLVIEKVLNKPRKQGTAGAAVTSSLSSSLLLVLLIVS
jgi:hypothetical protein